MVDTQMVLQAENVRYYSNGDEDAFFEWLKSIKCVTNYYGVLRTLYIEVDPEKVDLIQIRELIGLFQRYKISKTQLAQLEKEEFRTWLRQSGSYWQRSMFKRP